jgi:hypothetical protein
VILRLAGEVRQQLGLQLAISRTLVDLTVVKDFQDHVVEAIREESPETARRIVNLLKERRGNSGRVSPEQPKSVKVTTVISANRIASVLTSFDWSSRSRSRAVAQRRALPLRAFMAIDDTPHTLDE